MYLVPSQMQSKDDALSALKRRVEELELMDEEMQVSVGLRVHMVPLRTTCMTAW